MDDLFEKIIAGEIPSAKIYEDDATFSFLDINPNNKGHALIVPKQKYRNILDADPGALCAMVGTAQKVAKAVKTATGADGVNLVMNNESAAGQMVFHAHMHIIPRFEGDKVFEPSHHTSYEDGEMERMAEEIIKALD